MDVVQYIIIQTSVLPRQFRSNGRECTSGTEMCINREDDVLICVGKTKLRKPCHLLVWPTGVGAEEAAAKFVNHLSK